MADEALGLGTIVLFAPVPLLLELRRQLAVALCADLLGNAVFVAPRAASCGNRSLQALRQPSALVE